MDFAFLTADFSSKPDCGPDSAEIRSLPGVGAAVDLLVDVLHEIGLDGTKSACTGKVAGNVALGVVPSDLRPAFALERSRRAVHRGNRHGRFAIDVNMQIHNVVH